MVAGKKSNDMSNGAAKYQQQNMSFQRKDITGGGKSDGRSQNGTLILNTPALSCVTQPKKPALTLIGNANSFRTDSAISGSRNQGERVLQRWVSDAPEDTDGSLESGRMKSSSGAVWDQFAENERRFGLTTDYDENIYTTAIDKNHPQYKQRLVEAEKKAREIERSAATNSHVAEERVTDNVAGEENGADEEDK